MELALLINYFIHPSNNQTHNHQNVYLEWQQTLFTTTNEYSLKDDVLLQKHDPSHQTKV